MANDYTTKPPQTAGQSAAAGLKGKPSIAAYMKARGAKPAASTGTAMGASQKGDGKGKPGNIAKSRRMGGVPQPNQQAGKFKGMNGVPTGGRNQGGVELKPKFGNNIGAGTVGTTGRAQKYLQDFNSKGTAKGAPGMKPPVPAGNPGAGKGGGAQQGGTKPPISAKPPIGSQAGLPGGGIVKKPPAPTPTPVTRPPVSGTRPPTPAPTPTPVTRPLPTPTPTPVSKMPPIDIKPPTPSPTPSVMPRTNPSPIGHNSIATPTPGGGNVNAPGRLGMRSSTV